MHKAISKVCDGDLATASLSQRWRWGSNQPISFLMQQAVENPDVISLAAGLVDPATLPVEVTQTAIEHLWSSPERVRQSLQYGTTQGSAGLRENLRRHLARLEGCDVGGVTDESFLLTTGSQQLLALVSEILLDPGDICLVADPTYFAFIGTLCGVGAKIVGIPTDDGGVQVDAIESTMQSLSDAGQLDRVKLIYLNSYFDNPCGISLAAERREAVVRLAERWSQSHRIFLLEDAAYRELCYDGPDLPSLFSYDVDHQTVILAQTFSKSFSPGLRVGYGVVPQSLVGPLCDRKGNEDFGSANLCQHLLAQVFESGLYESHVARLRASYCQKRDWMLAAAETHCRDIPGVSWVHPKGGLYVWMTIPEEIETGFDSPLFAAAKEEGVLYVPGEFCYSTPETAARNTMRLSYGVCDREGIEEGIRRLSRALRRTISAS